MLFVVKKLLPMRNMESIWLQWMAYMLCPWVVFPSKKTFVDKILPNLVKKTLNTYVVFALANYLSITCTFDLWMSKGAHDFSTCVVNFISSDLEANHMMIGLFEMIDTSNAAMVPKL
jgi:hypothetical protein